MGRHTSLASRGIRPGGSHADTSSRCDLGAVGDAHRSANVGNGMVERDTLRALVRSLQHAFRCPPTATRTRSERHHCPPMAVSSHLPTAGLEWPYMGHAHPVPETGPAGR